MRIAIPIVVVENAPTLAQEFSRASLFALYDVHDDTRAVSYIGRESLESPGCARTPSFLKEHGVEVILGHSVSQNAQNSLLEQGILAIRDAEVMSPDALLAHLVSGTLKATAPEPAVHGGGCGGGGCGHCSSHSHTHEEAAGHSCGSGGCGTHEH